MLVSADGRPLPALDLPDHLLLLLQEKPEGRSEYELIQQLKRRHSTHVPNLPLTDKLVLFRTHFLVFNALYLLRDRLWAEGSGHLQISPCIQLLPYARQPPGSPNRTLCASTTWTSATCATPTRTM